MEILKQNYLSNCQTPGDINEHLPTLYKYATECESILELGVRGVISSWAFVNGLMNNGMNTKRLMVNDLSKCDINSLQSVCSEINLELTHEWIDCLKMNVSDLRFDMTFIDTWHVYPQLKRELEKFSAITNKYIVMHDTEIDGIFGEGIRYEATTDFEKQSRDSGFSVEDIRKGLSYAINEFLENNAEWVVEKVFTNNNGLTILRRKSEGSP